MEACTSLNLGAHPSFESGLPLESFYQNSVQPRNMKQIIGQSQNRKFVCYLPCRFHRVDVIDKFIWQRMKIFIWLHFFGLACHQDNCKDYRQYCLHIKNSVKKIMLTVIKLEMLENICCSVQIDTHTACSDLHNDRKKTKTWTKKYISLSEGRIQDKRCIAK